MWTGYNNYDHFFEVGQPRGVDNWIDEIISTNPENIKVGKERIWNIPVSFDIETSSYYKMGEKCATMYLWSMCFNGSSILGRTWKEFTDVIKLIVNIFQTKKCKLLIFVHNLGYEFQFMRGWFIWENVFASKERRPIYARLNNGIEFRCSYILSNYALAYIGEELLDKYKVEKDVGALDYSLLRNSKTGLTQTEKWYSVHDVQVVTSYIQEKIEQDGGINEIPLTNTGYVRKYTRDYCFNQELQDAKLRKKSRARYKESMKSLVITSKCEYDQLHQAFAGGFTHANPFWSGKTIKVGDEYEKIDNINEE